MPSVLILGAGKIGRMIASFLSRSDGGRRWLMTSRWWRISFRDNAPSMWRSQLSSRTNSCDVLTHGWIRSSKILKTIRPSGASSARRRSSRFRSHFVRPSWSAVA